jgi:flagellar protein FliS
MFPENSRAAMNAYRSVGVESIVDSATPHQMVLMLFNGARAAVVAAKLHLQRQEIAAKCEAISKVIAIIDGGLKASLDLNVGGELAQNLSDLYAYMTQRLLHANLNNDGGALDEVAQLLAHLGEAWETMAAKPVSATPASATPAASPSQPGRVAAAYGRV